MITIFPFACALTLFTRWAVTKGTVVIRKKRRWK
jgi:hypothetical protein